jgi:tetratricopeptide (TPR) repeat protein
MSRASTSTTFRAFAAVACIALIAATAGCSTEPLLTNRDSLLVADFSNATGDKAWDDALKPVVSVLLQQTPFLSITPDFRVQRVLRAMQQPPDQPVSGEAGRALCKRLGARAIVDGALAATASGVNLTLTVTDCGTSKELARTQVLGDRATIIDALRDGVYRLRQKLGEPRASLEKYNVAAAPATSASLQALQSYGRGLKARVVAGDGEAIPYFQQAISEDPAFALAYAKLGVVDYNTGRLEESRQLAQEAHDLRDKVTEYERLYIDWNFASRVQQDPKVIKASLEQLTTEYPRDFAARNNFGVFYNGAGEYEEALKQYRAASDLAPDEPGPLSNAAYVLMTLGRYDEASDMVDRAMAIRPDPNLALARWITAKIAGAPRAAEFENVARNLTPPEQMATIDASLAAWSGQFKKFEAMQRDFIAHAKGSANPDAAAAAATGRLITLAVYRGGHDLDELRATAAREKNPALLAQQLSALSIVGDINAVRAGLAKLPPDAAKDSVLATSLAVPRAYVEARDGHAAEAVASLQSLMAITPRLKELNYFIGDIKEQSGDLDAAIASYKAVTESVTFIGTNPIIPLSRLRLAKALIKKGDNAGAKAQLDTLLAQWKDADTEFPALLEARKLRSGL